ncbi:NUDIX domain-containing protein [Pseudoalteromonas luteoviolacea]|uniref:NUDIX domain-containing protein n=1 Tax=Pseudoalteromonas luteoviolacea TaxID=43657 RepID=UPI001B3A35CA|nr:NUDIX domain-containing protein [Pseudoalteromonas luteoviolacea]MBQ4876983.1 NUDIX domain-containing protein [Pseudoalteromonas luteoviolacea]MBQ4905844.1 NUDIX domain-containing protein [Pseudoalteromonas luteoviolacea]
MKEISQYNRENLMFKTSENRVLYDGFFKIEEYVFEHALFAGGVSEPIRREILERGHAVAVLPYDPVSDEILLIEQIRIGALATKDSPWLLECIAGMAEGSDDLEAVVRKEAQEEAGLDLSELHYMRSYLSSPGGTTERLYLYLAQVNLRDYQGGTFGLPEEGEDIKAHVMSFDEAICRLESEEIDNAATVISLQWLALNKSKLSFK